MSRPSLGDADIAQFKTGPNDTGSSSLQIALLTKRIESLTQHLLENKKDYATKRGLQMLLGKRQRLTRYLKRDDEAMYTKTMEGLGLKIK
jgi:small subunit ribosomal protein S15|tara:strand:+ start:12372 stop:12641 length:270 start_codon:yes stop_codon:yes gene_type:complete